MIRLGVVVEGTTEEIFVKKVLYPPLLERGVCTFPFLLGRRGGNVTVAGLAHDLWNYKQSHDAVTSLVDYYGFRDKGERNIEELEQAILSAIRRRTSRAVDDRFVFPYVQKHEFEALLFSDVANFAFVGADDAAVERLGGIRERFSTPEDIDDDPNTAPSKRIPAAFQRYRKPVHGPLVAERTGLFRIRAACPRFDWWVAKVESLPVARGLTDANR